MKAHFSILLLLTLAFSGCKENGYTGAKKITKISFATGGCFGECPFLAMEVDSSLNIRYYGGEFAALQGYYEGRISRSLWDTINIKFASLLNKDLETNVRTVDDMPIECIIHFEETVKKIAKQESELPEAIRDDFYWLIGIAKKASLEKVGDTLTFETVIQHAPKNMSIPAKTILNIVCTFGYAPLCN